ncbi:MAG: Ig-like domain-containing protein [Lachnospiraceae bacterium]|nr:Ig-like domain-containing protein [Lachnospiraceae bacterium]
MAARVEIINNPYQQQLKILIDGQAVSVFSNLEKYTEEPFSYWCDKILDSIYEECNCSNFCLHYCSRREELKVMERICQNYEHCIQYSSGPHIRNTPLLERIKNLNQLLRASKTSGFQVSSHDVLFILPEALKDLETDLRGMEVHNTFCRINANVTYYQDYIRKRHKDDTIFLICKDQNVQDYIYRTGMQNGFVIELGKKNEFKQKIGDVFVYESTEDAFFETIFECLLLLPLLKIFLSCIQSLPSEIKQQYREEIENLQSIELKLIPVPEKTVIEVGKSSRIHFKTDLDGREVRSTKLHFSYSIDEIIRCNGMLVEGLKEGESVLKIFKEGEQIPCASVAYTVIRRNRITELSMEDRCITIGEGDVEKLNVTYLPADADNVNCIEFESDDEKVAKVDAMGNIHGIARGNCTIRCFAEQISVSCRCIVKPYLKSISIDEYEMIMLYGEEREVKIRLAPDDCIDDEIVFSSMNMRIINIVGRTLKAIGTGQTRVVIQNRQGTVRSEISIRVMTEKEYKEYQKQKESGEDVFRKKKKRTGVLSKLFGRNK